MINFTINYFVGQHHSSPYAALTINYDLIVIAIKTLGFLITKESTFLRELGRRLTIVISRNGFLFQRISVVVQRFNVIRIRGSFPVQVNID